MAEVLKAKGLTVDAAAIGVLQAAGTGGFVRPLPPRAQCQRLMRMHADGAAVSPCAFATAGVIVAVGLRGLACAEFVELLASEATEVAEADLKAKSKNSTLVRVHAQHVSSALEVRAVRGGWGHRSGRTCSRHVNGLGFCVVRQRLELSQYDADAKARVQQLSVERARYGGANGQGRVYVGATPL